MPAHSTDALATLAQALASLEETVAELHSLVVAAYRGDEGAKAKLRRMLEGESGQRDGNGLG